MGASETTTETASGTGAEIPSWGTTNETGLGFTVLGTKVRSYTHNAMDSRKTYLTNINKTTHQALVAERIHGVLCLVPGCIFHNPGTQVSKKVRFEESQSSTHPHPYNMRSANAHPSTPTQTTKIGGIEGTSPSTCKRPPSTFH